MMMMDGDNDYMTMTDGTCSGIDVMATTDPATLASLGRIEVWGTPGVGAGAGVALTHTSSDTGPSTSTSSARPYSTHFQSNNTRNDAVTNHEGDATTTTTTTTAANRHNHRTTTNGHSRNEPPCMQLIDVKIKEVGKDSAATT